MMTMMTRMRAGYDHLFVYYLTSNNHTRSHARMHSLTLLTFELAYERFGSVVGNETLKIDAWRNFRNEDLVAHIEDILRGVMVTGLGLWAYGVHINSQDYDKSLSYNVALTASFDYYTNIRSMDLSSIINRLENWEHWEPGAGEISS